MNDHLINITAPELPESVIDATIVKWHKKEGDFVIYNDILVDIETDKIVLEVPSPAKGIIKKILKSNNSKIKSKDILGQILKQNQLDITVKKVLSNHNDDNTKELNVNTIYSQKKFLSPSLRRLSKNCNLVSSNDHSVNYKNHNITKKTINNHVLKPNDITNNTVLINKKNNCFNNTLKRNSVRTLMSPIRKKISERLLQAQKDMAILTTFNEVNMHSIIQLRKKHGKNFLKKYQIKLGFMPFFVKSVAAALQKFPEINASIDNEEIVQYNYIDISVAISTSKGLIAPVLRDANYMSIFNIEHNIQDFLIKANLGKLTFNDLTGGNITISNGGVFGSLMSTPIINPPQSTILGIHAITNRPMVVDNKIKILPMMYLALSYDHRLIDGKQAIRFLMNIKNNLEDCNRILLDL